MFDFLKDKKEKLDEKTFHFIWYKKMTMKDKVHYTAPFRTSVSAKTKEEAEKKLTDFVERKMELCIVEEKDFKKQGEFSVFQEEFEKLSKLMEKTFSNLGKLF